LGDGGARAQKDAAEGSGGDVDAFGTALGFDLGADAGVVLDYPDGLEVEER
jgi:hypothetical protein